VSLNTNETDITILQHIDINYYLKIATRVTLRLRSKSDIYSTPSKCILLFVALVQNYNYVYYHWTTLRSYSCITTRTNPTN